MFELTCCKCGKKVVVTQDSLYILFNGKMSFEADLCFKAGFDGVCTVECECGQMIVDKY